MKASSLLDTAVLIEKDRKWCGKICDIRICDHRIVALVLSEGGIFSKAQMILPEAVLKAEYDHITIASDQSVQRLSAKEMREKMKGTSSITGARVKDRDGDYFARIADAVIDLDYRISEYELSRSFFDDLDYGYGIVRAEEMHVDSDGSFVYERDMLDIQKTGREGGILKKLLGEEREK